MGNKLGKITTLVFIVCLQLSAQTLPAGNPLSDFNFLIGEWKGTSHGVEGDGVCKKSVTVGSDSNLIVSHNDFSFENSKSYPPSDKHEHKSVYSFNKEDSSLVVKVLNSEGHTTCFKEKKKSSGKDKKIFLSQKIENGPPGLKVRRTILKLSDDSYTETLEYKYPSRDYIVWRTTTWEKIK